MASDDPREDYPAISKRTMLRAVERLLSHYGEDHLADEFIPEAVRLDQLPDYDEFFAKFLIPNQLCILSESATRHWRSRQEWVCQDGSPDFDFLQGAFGEATVPVANCKTKEFSAHPKSEMKMSEFLSYWRRHRETEHPNTDESLYLKDWHFTRAFPEYQAYRTCSFFQSDWMNEFWDVREDIDDDYRFVYMGPKDTWTPFHADVFRSFSWSANICGRKRWIFFPPGEEQHLKDIHGTLVYDVTSEELADASKYPDAHKIQHRIEIIQEPGETIFVPSSWHHQVHNLEDTISINHNWLNGSNVRHTWQHLKASLAEVEKEISDCRDMDGWDQQCQMILRALTGMDYSDFFQFMKSVSRNRIRALNSRKKKAADSRDFEVSQSNTNCMKSEDVLLSCGKCLSVAAKNRTCEACANTIALSAPCSESQAKAEMSECRKCQTCADRNELDANCSELQTEVEMSKYIPDMQRADSELQTCPICITHETKCHQAHAAHNTSVHQTHTTHETALPQNHAAIGTPSQETQAILKSALHQTPSTSEKALLQTQTSCESASQQTHHVNATVPKEASSLPHEQDKFLRSVLDLSESSSKTAGEPNQRPHWSRCNVHHAVFDLASVALALRDMERSLALSGLGRAYHEGDESGYDETGRDNFDLDKDIDGGENTHRVQDEKEMNFDHLLGEISQSLSAFGITSVLNCH